MRAGPGPPQRIFGPKKIIRQASVVRRASQRAVRFSRNEVTCLRARISRAATVIGTVAKRPFRCRHGKKTFPGVRVRHPDDIARIREYGRVRGTEAVRTRPQRTRTGADFPSGGTDGAATHRTAQR